MNLDHFSWRTDILDSRGT